MLSLRSLGFGTGRAGISKRDEAEDWPDVPLKSVAPPTLLPCNSGRRVPPEAGKDVVRECV